jgi:hypothetical protein
MRRVFGLTGATAGGWLGWAIGEPFSLLLAFIVGMIGTGIGMYIGYRLAARYS